MSSPILVAKNVCTINSLIAANAFSKTVLTVAELTNATAICPGLDTSPRSANHKTNRKITRRPTDCCSGKYRHNTVRLILVKMSTIITRSASYRGTKFEFRVPISETPLPFRNQRQPTPRFGFVLRGPLAVSVLRAILRTRFYVFQIVHRLRWPNKFDFDAKIVTKNFIRCLQDGLFLPKRLFQCKIIA